MGKSNIEQLNIAKKYLGQGGSHFRKYCGLPAGAAWCDAYVTTIFHEAGNKDLFCGGTKQTYCPTTIKWCYNNLASIPPYLALPSDIIFFDWELNGVPNHIGFVRERKSCDEIYTIEGNTGNSICANRTRNTKYVQAVFRPHFKPTAFDPNKALVIDGLMGYNTIAVVQKALKAKGVYSGAIDAIMGQGTVKAIQKWAGVAQDGAWATKTSKAIQKKLGVTADGLFGKESCKAFQKWANAQVFPQQDPLKKWYDAMTTQYKWSKNQKYKWVSPTIESSKKKGTCITFPSVSLQRLGMLPSGGYAYFNPDSNKLADKPSGWIKEHSEWFELFYPNKTATELWKEGKIKKGDIVGFDNPNYHTMVFMGMKNGKPIWNTMGGGKRGLNVEYPYYANRKISMIIRIKRVK